MSKSHSLEELRSLMRPAMAVALMSLIGGESLQLYNPNLTQNERVKNNGMVRDVPEGMVGFGSSVVVVMANGYYRVAYAYFVDERCRELFGFGLTMEGDHVVLKRPESKGASASLGYSYYKDEQGRDMIVGDYTHELNNAYMDLLNTPQFAHVDPAGHAYIYSNSAKIYIADLLITAAWCGDEVVVTDCFVKIEGKGGSV